MFRKIIAVLNAVILGGICFAPIISAAGADSELFVSPDGDDSASGGITEPLATLEGAKKAAKSISGRVTVYFREGTYSFNKTVCFDENDKSGVTYKAYNGERVVFSSGTAYSGFESCTVNGLPALKKYVGKDADFNTLFDENKMLEQGRYPESGYLKVKAVSDDDILVKPDTQSEYHTSQSGMYVDTASFGEFKNINDITVKLLHFWKDETLKIADYDSESGHLRFDKGSSMTIKEGDRFFLLNVYEGLNKPGQWYLDKSDGMLYVMAEDGVNPDYYTVWGSAVETMIVVDGADSISFENIIFRGNGNSYLTEREHSQAAYNVNSCVSYKNANDFHVKNCEFRDIAACCVFMGESVKNAEVDSCIFDNIGAQAVYVRGDNVDIDDDRVTRDIRIVNNSISDYGRNYYNAVGVLVIHANSVEVAHNEIHDGYYTAISVGWVWGYSYSVTYNNKICDNLIYNIGQGWLSDMGGIYTLGNQPGTVISGNVIHNVAADPGEGGYGGWGVYLDEGSSYITVEKNLVYACGSDAYHLHYGSYNTVRNNIFALSGESQFRAVSAPGRVTPEDDGKKTADVYSNIFLTDNKARAVSHIRDNAAWQESNNTYWDISNGSDIYIGIYDNPDHATGIRTAVRKGYITSPIIADPMFKDAANFDFELNENSPAVKAGFEPWNYQSSGTEKGTVIGLAGQGGSTVYNANSNGVEMTGAKERFHKLLEFIYKIYAFLVKLFK